MSRPSAPIPSSPATRPGLRPPRGVGGRRAAHHAQIYGYTVVDASTVMATHLSTDPDARRRAARPPEMQQLLDHLTKKRRSSPKTWCPSCMRCARCRRCCKTCSTKSVHIRDMRTILDVLAEHAPNARKPNELTALVRSPWAAPSPSRCSRARRTAGDRPGPGSLDGALQQALTSSAGSSPAWPNTCCARRRPPPCARSSWAGAGAARAAPLRVLLSRFLRRAAATEGAFPGGDP